MRWSRTYLSEIETDVGHPHDIRELMFSSSHIGGWCMKMIWFDGMYMEMIWFEDVIDFVTTLENFVWNWFHDDGNYLFFFCSKIEFGYKCTFVKGFRYL